LEPTIEVENSWRESIELMFSTKINLPIYQETDDDIIKDMKGILKEETRKEVRKKVFQVLQKYCPRLVNEGGSLL